MSFLAKRELLAQIAVRYQEANQLQRTVILDEFVAATGYARKYATRLLTHPPAPPAPKIQRRRERHYGPAVQQALVSAWSAANFVCGKRLVPFLPELVAALERHGHLALADESRQQLLLISPATVDRILKPLRQGGSHRGLTTTRAGTLLKHRVPVRTFADWDEQQPGFLEADLVAHCGHSAEGSFLRTLVLTDIATGWTECLPLLHGSQEAVLQALGRARQLLPFPLLGLDTDNGKEFLNEQLLAYCRQEAITFTRGRAYKKNDQCFVEQKNGFVVRQLVGYDRYDGERAYRQLTELYRAARLYVNFFQPSMKLLSKKRDGAKVTRKYDAAQTPYQRLLGSGTLSARVRERLESVYAALDPVRLLRQLELLQDALWRHAVVAAAPNTLKAPVTARTASKEVVSKEQAAASAETGAGALPALTGGGVELRVKRKYRRSDKPRVPHTWRTREDPFEQVWEEVYGWLAAEPERTAKSLFLRLQTLYPLQFPDGQLRCLQRRVKQWRAQMILEFDSRWLDQEPLAGLTALGNLRGSAAA
jgi:hypothetical protein